MQSTLGRLDTLLDIVKKRKVRWFGLVVRAKGTLANIKWQGELEVGISRERPARQWLDGMARMICEGVSVVWRKHDSRDVIL